MLHFLPPNRSGAVVKEANEVFNRIVRYTSHGDLSRTGWQLLNFLHHQADASDKTNVADHLSFFEFSEGVEAILRRFETEGLVTASNGKVVTTDKGKGGAARAARHYGKGDR